jgi:hypothetical protein
MMKTNGLSRRTFIKITFLMSVLMFMPQLLFERERKKLKEALLEEQIGLMLKNRESAAAIGKEYLRLNPQYSDAQLLMQSLGNDDQFWNVHPGRYLHERIVRDYRQSRLIHLKGWRISQTEALLCALAARKVSF